MSDFGAVLSEIQMLSPCVNCAHKHMGRSSCAAFAAAIPADILDGTNDHRKPYPGDNGITFEPLPDTPTDPQP